MGWFESRKKKSSRIAKDRLKLLLVSERLDCSPTTMIMLKNDLIQTISKYMTMEEDQVTVSITYSPSVLTAQIPFAESHPINYS